MRGDAMALLLSFAVSLGTAVRAQEPTAPGAVAGARRVNPMTAPRPTAVTVRDEGAIVLDDLLDKPAWRRASVLTEFLQQLPQTEMPATYRTEVRMFEDERPLYLEAVNHDPAPYRAIIVGLERDFQTPQSDIAGVAFDTFHDRDPRRDVARAGALARTLSAGPSVSFPAMASSPPRLRAMGAVLPMSPFRTSPPLTCRHAVHRFPRDRAPRRGLRRGRARARRNRHRLEPHSGQGRAAGEPRGSRRRHACRRRPR